VSARRQHKVKPDSRPGATSAPIAALLFLFFAGCASQQQVYMQPVSIEKVEYYPFLVKGYQNTYPKRRMLVITADDARDSKDAGANGNQSYEGHPAIGVIVDQTGKIDQRLYGSPLGPMVAQAIAQAAQEAGMVSSTAPEPLNLALTDRKSDYVLTARIKRLWANKHRGPDNQAGPTWFTTADVALDVAIYKPPFSVPFWQGTSAANYDDPALPPAGSSTEDETQIYDNPGQVLSVALTRAVAGIFRQEALHTLIAQDAAHGQ
jgi:hypothetical protein